MTWRDLDYDAVILATGFFSYLWGYRNGVAYCVRQLGPFQELLNQLRAARKP